MASRRVLVNEGTRGDTLFGMGMRRFIDRSSRCCAAGAGAEAGTGPAGTPPAPVQAPSLPAHVVTKITTPECSGEWLLPKIKRQVGRGEWDGILELLMELRERELAGTAVIEETDALMRGIPPVRAPRRQAALAKTNSWNLWTQQHIYGRAWPPGMWMLFTMHRSGYVREHACMELTQRCTAAEALPWLLLRMNDWVPQVRELAGNAVRDLLTQEHVAVWLGMLPLVGRLEGQGRADHRWIVEGARALLARPESRAVLRTALGAKDVGTRRAVYEVALGLPLEERVEFIAAAGMSKDPVIRLRAAQQVLENAAFEGRGELLTRLRTDHFVAVRRVALYAMLRESPGEARAWLVRCLLDGHASIRHAARFYLKDQADRWEKDAEGTVVPREVYLAEIGRKGKETLAAAIAGLGECGERGDAAMLTPFADDPRPAVAHEAVGAVGTLDRDHRQSWLIEKMGDGRPRVAREAAKQVGLASGVELAEVRKVARGSKHRHCRAFALRVILQRFPYDGLVDGIEGAVDSSEEISRIAGEYLRDLTCDVWRYQPHAGEVRAAILRLRGVLPAEVLRALGRAGFCDDACGGR